jgi:hypothetical protein
MVKNSKYPKNPNFGTCSDLHIDNILTLCIGNITFIFNKNTKYPNWISILDI